MLLLYTSTTMPHGNSVTMVIINIEGVQKNTRTFYMGIHNILSVRGDTKYPRGMQYILGYFAWGYNISGDTKYPVTPGTQSTRGTVEDRLYPSLPWTRIRRAACMRKILAQERKACTNTRTPVRQTSAGPPEAISGWSGPA